MNNYYAAILFSNSVNKVKVLFAVTTSLTVLYAVDHKPPHHGVGWF